MKIRRSVVALMMLCSPVSAENLSCDMQLVNVNFRDPDHAELVCNSVEKATNLFESCGAQLLKRSIQIALVRELKKGCVGLYHCGGDLIEILEPDDMQLARDADDAFSILPIEEYFSSVIVHEMVHAISDDLHCPFENCLVRDEYIAHALQVMSLTKQRQIQFERKAGLNRPISRDELNMMGLFLSPKLFSQKVWLHLNQRDEPCEYINQLSLGHVLLDRERF